MRQVYNSVCAILMAVLMIACCTVVASAQPAAQLAQKATTAVPRLVRFGGTLTDAAGKPLSGVVGITFALYAEQEGGAPIWMETQNVEADGNGSYTALLGATRNEGIPAEAFGTGQRAEQRWLGVEPQGQSERPRVLMTSVPYSLKSVDAETLGGLPASAFALSGRAGNAAGGSSVASARVVAGLGSAKPAATPATDVTGSGTIGTLAVWTGTETIGNAAITQKSGNVGIPTPETGTKFAVSATTGDAILGATSSTSGAALTGAATAVSGTTTGVYGLNASTAGTAVLGIASATTGSTVGVAGTSDSTDGTAVVGLSSATKGTATGVGGGSDSPDGYGMLGTNSATTGAAVGVYGTTNSTEGNGVQGVATAETGDSSGVYGTAASSSGSAVQGDATSDTGDTFGVYGSASSTSGIGTQGEATATSGVTYGVNGLASSPSGFGVRGFNDATTGSAIGTIGISAGSSGIGVQGQATASSGSTFGVIGTTVSPAGISVEGEANAKTGTAFGVVGLNDSTSGVAVQGQATAESGTTYGVTGESSSTEGVGVVGQGLATTGATWGVLGTNVSTSGTGVQGKALAESGINWGVVGTALSAEGVGVYGIAVASSALAGDLAGTPVGVWGDTKDGTAGVLATSDDGEAIAAYNNASNVATLYVENQEHNTDTSVVLATNSSYGGYCDIFVSGNLMCSGSVGGHAYLGADASREVSMYAVQAPENWFEDTGSGQLHNGAAVVALDADYAQTVNTGMAYHVFLTPNGDCKGLYVSRKSATSFEVHELGGGSSSIAFDYRIVAKRKGFENIRMADLTGKIQKRVPLKTATAIRPAGPALGAVSVPTAARAPHIATARADAVKPRRTVKRPAHAVRPPLHAAKPAPAPR